MPKTLYRARSTRGQENEAWVLYKKIPSRESWGDLHGNDTSFAQSHPSVLKKYLIEGNCSYSSSVNQSLPSVNHEQFPTQMAHKHNKWLQILAQEDPGAEIMLNLLFNTLLTITPHNTQKRRRRKERTTYRPLRRYSRLVTHPGLNPDRQGLTWVPLPNRVSRGLLRDTYF